MMSWTKKLTIIQERKEKHPFWMRIEEKHFELHCICYPKELMNIISPDQIWVRTALDSV